MFKKIAFASVGLALLASPLFVSAQGNLSASPTSGQAPLAVSFSYTIGGNIASPGDYSIDFGDSQTGAVTIGCGIVPPGSNACSRALVGSHTYTAARIYTAKLRDDRRGCAPVDCNVIGTATITVTESSCPPNADNCNFRTTFTASPTSGQAPLAVQFTSTAPPGGNIGNIVNFGDGTSGTLNPAPVCAICNLRGTASHTYTQAGTYTAKLKDGRRGCAPVDCDVVGTVTITVTDDTTSPTFSATPTSGTAPLAVSFTGSGLNGILTYLLNFGDGQTGSLMCTSGGAGSICTGSTSHTYASAGTYTAQLFRHVGGPRGPDLLVGTVTITVSG